MIKMHFAQMCKCLEDSLNNLINKLADEMTRGKDSFRSHSKVMNLQKCLLSAAKALDLEDLVNA